MKRRILIVEDDAELRHMVAELLGQAGYDVCTAADGLQGLRQVVDDPPDLILSDVLMPTMTGLELCALLKDSAQTAHIPVVFLTCVDDPVKGFDVGADDYLVKPFRPRELLARVRAVFRRTHAIPPELVAEGLRGSLTELSLPEVLQTLHVGRASGCLTVVTPDAEQRCRLWLEEGELVAGRLDGPQPAEGEDALFAAVPWTEGIFAFDSTHRAESWTVQNTMEQLLLEAARRFDEAGAEQAAALADLGAKSCSLQVQGLTHDVLVSRIEEIRTKLKLKAYEAMLAGRPLTPPGRAPACVPPDPGVTLPPEIDALIEDMLRKEV